MMKSELAERNLPYAILHDCAAGGSQTGKSTIKIKICTDRFATMMEAVSLVPLLTFGLTDARPLN